MLSVGNATIGMNDGPEIADNRCQASYAATRGILGYSVRKLGPINLVNGNAHQEICVGLKQADGHSEFLEA